MEHEILSINELKGYIYPCNYTLEMQHIDKDELSKVDGLVSESYDRYPLTLGCEVTSNGIESM